MRKLLPHIAIGLIAGLTFPVSQMFVITIIGSLAISSIQITMESKK